MLRGENYHIRTKTQDVVITQYIGGFWGDWATYSPNYEINSQAVTANPVDICGEIWEPSDPKNDGFVTIDEPETDKDILLFKKFANWLKTSLASNSVLKKGLAICAIVLLIMIFITVLSFIFKWFKYIFGIGK